VKSLFKLRSGILAFGIFALAFVTDPLELCAQIPKGDAFVGYSRSGADTFYPNVGGLNGWQGALHVKLHVPFVGVEGDLAHYGIGANSAVPRTTTYLFGPRVTAGTLGVHLFAHALVGGEHSANSAGLPVSNTSLAYALGGGLDVPLVPFFGWRFAGDYIRAPRVSPGGNTPARFSTGLVFRF
jgi:hypothetical protein